MVRSRIREDQIVDADVLSEHEHLVLTHTNLLVSGTLTVLSGTLTDDGKFYCQEAYAEGNAIFVGDHKISTTAEGALLVNDSPDISGVGHTGSVVVVTGVDEGTSTYTKSTLTFENGFLTTVSGMGTFDMPPSLLLE